MTVTVIALAMCATVSVVSSASHGRVLKTAAVAVATAALAVAAIASAVASPAEGSVRGIVVTLVVVVAAFGGVALVPVVFDLVEIDHRDTDDRDQLPRDDETPPEGDDETRRRDDDTGRRPLRGGRVIGVLERLAVVGALVAGWPEGIAVVLAVKGLARYPEIRDQHAGEQFIIGTFASVLWAVAAAGVARLALT
ncbi:hypothetical protein ACXVUM_17240 [Williamsia sp. SKLECPSW1]